jgi:hypothetical protein
MNLLHHDNAWYSSLLGLRDVAIQTASFHFSIMQSFSMRRPVDLSGRWEGEAPASPSGAWTITRLSAGRVPCPAGSRVISVSIWKWNHGLLASRSPSNDDVNI